MRDGAPCTSLVARTSRGGAAALSCPTSRVRLMREDGKRTSRVVAGWGVRAWVTAYCLSLSILCCIAYRIGVFLPLAAFLVLIHLITFQN